MSEFEDALDARITSIMSDPDYFYGREYGWKAAGIIMNHFPFLFRRTNTDSIAFLAGLQGAVMERLGVEYLKRIAEAQGGSGEG